MQLSQQVSAKVHQFRNFFDSGLHFVTRLDRLKREGRLIGYMRSVTPCNSYDFFVGELKTLLEDGFINQSTFDEATKGSAAQSFAQAFNFSVRDTGYGGRDTLRAFIVLHKAGQSGIPGAPSGVNFGIKEIVFVATDQNDIPQPIFFFRHTYGFWHRECAKGVVAR